MNDPTPPARDQIGWRGLSIFVLLLPKVRETLRLGPGLSAEQSQPRASNGEAADDEEASRPLECGVTICDGG